MTMVLVPESPGFLENSYEFRVYASFWELCGKVMAEQDLPLYITASYLSDCFGLQTMSQHKLRPLLGRLRTRLQQQQQQSIPVVRARPRGRPYLYGSGAYAVQL